MPYLKKIKNYINHVKIPLTSAFFDWKLITFVISRNTDIDSI